MQEQTQGPTKICPNCRGEILAVARKCRHCKRWIHEWDDESSQPDTRADYLPCPKCHSNRIKKVVFTFWGSFYGPALFCHVRCLNCGATYNGKTGKSNVVPATFFVAIPALLIVILIAGFVYLAISLAK